MGVIETVKQNKNKKGKSTLKLLHSSDIYISIQSTNHKERAVWIIL